MRLQALRLLGSFDFHRDHIEHVLFFLLSGSSVRKSDKGRKCGLAAWLLSPWQPDSFVGMGPHPSQLEVMAEVLFF
jgi:hypothetical protein